VNVEKTRMMVFDKRKRKNEENDWNWEGGKIEQVNGFRYMGYTFNERVTDQKDNKESSSGMCFGNRREKVGE
jgi:hypothetical protein